MAEVIERAVVMVGGVEISPAAIAAEAQNHPAGDADEAWQSAAEALAIKQMLLAEADRLGIEAGEIEDAEGRKLTGEDARIETLLAQEVTVPEATEAEARRFYARHQDRFASEALVEAGHILLSASPDDTLGYTMALSDARGLIRRLEADPGSFARLAREYSACPSKEQGGNLGQIGEGQTVAEFEDALFALGEGELCREPVRTRFGVHIVRAGRRVERQQLPFEAVAASIRAYLEEASYRRAAAQYLAILAGRTHVEGVDLRIAQGPLVQ
jgi:peptidyl-prolyl cis-trans isomerase C